MALERFTAKAALAWKLARVTLTRRFRVARTPAAEVAALIGDYAADGVRPIDASERECQRAAFACLQCSSFCDHACPVLALPEGARFAGPAAALSRVARAAIDLIPLRASLADCVGCGLCQAACPHGVALLDVLRGAWTQAAGRPAQGAAGASETPASAAIAQAASLTGPVALLVSPRTRGSAAQRALIDRWLRARPELVVIGGDGDRPAVSGLAQPDLGDPGAPVRAALARALIARLEKRGVRTVLCDDPRAAEHLAAHREAGSVLDFLAVSV